MRGSRDLLLIGVATDPNDIQHSQFPIGPVGKPTEFHLFFNQMVMKYTKFPKAAKEFLRFMMEQEQFDPWLTGAGGYISQPLRAFEKSAIWTVDPKHTPYRDATKNMRPSGYAGKLGYASAGVLADSAQGGLKRDLSRAFELTDAEFNATEFGAGAAGALALAVGVARRVERRGGMAAGGRGRRGAAKRALVFFQRCELTGGSETTLDSRRDATPRGTPAPTSAPHPASRSSG